MSTQIHTGTHSQAHMSTQIHTGTHSHAHTYTQVHMVAGPVCVGMHPNHTYIYIHACMHVRPRVGVCTKNARKRGHRARAVSVAP